MSSSSERNKRANIRLSEEEKDIIAKAAKLQKKNFSAFVIESSCSVASELLATQTIFNLSKDKWETFCETLDRSPQDNPALKKLLTESSLFDE